MSLNPQAVRDQRFVRKAIEAKVLQPVTKFKAMKMIFQAIIFFCGDLKHAKDKLLHFWRCITDESHLVALNGGAMLLDGLSPVNRGQINYVEVALDQIRGAIRLKQKQGIVIKTVYLMVHAFCGVAEDLGISVQQQFHSVINAKHFLKDEAKIGTKVGLLFHWHDEEQEGSHTFYFSAKEMLHFLQSYVEEVGSDLQLTEDIVA